MENVENTIYKPLDFETLWGRMPQTPQQIRTSGTCFQAPQLEISLVVPENINGYYQLNYLTRCLYFVPAHYQNKTKLFGTPSVLSFYYIL